MDLQQFAKAWHDHCSYYHKGRKKERLTFLIVLPNGKKQWYRASPKLEYAVRLHIKTHGNLPHDFFLTLISTSQLYLILATTVQLLVLAKSSFGASKKSIAVKSALVANLLKAVTSYICTTVITICVMTITGTADLTS